MAIGPGIYKAQYENCSLDELEKELRELEKFLLSDELKEMRQEEIDRGVDDNNCITNVETEIEVLKELIANKKTNNSAFTSYVNMNCLEIKALIEEKFNLLKDKLAGKIDDNERENSGYLFWNCKTILRNIYMAYDKLTDKFKEELSSKEIADFMKKSDIIKTNENNWKDLDDIKSTFNLLLDDKNNDAVEDISTVIEKCMCGNELKINWKPDEKFQMVRCSNCNAEIKFRNPNLIEEKLDDIINKVVSGDPFWETTIKKYFDGLTTKNDNDKINFLKKIVKNKNLFNEFTKEILNSDDSERLFNKYNIISTVCPNCGTALTFLMPDGTRLYCNKCNKYYLNDNGNVGEETTSPYTRDDVLY